MQISLSAEPPVGRSPILPARGARDGSKALANTACTAITACGHLLAEGNGQEAAQVARNVVAPVAGQLLARLVQVGDAVAADTEIAIVEAMKMHIPVSAEQAGRVAKWLVDEKGVVAEGQPLLTLEG